jgi:hypothetical protein
MNIRDMTTLLPLAAVALWGILAVGRLEANTMPPPDEPASTGAAEASEAEASQSTIADGMDDERGASDEEPAEVDVDADANAASASLSSEAGPPSDGIRPRTNVVGEVVGHPTGKVLLAAHDVVTLRLDRSQDVKSHDRYAIARREQFVEHPDSGRNMGYVVRVVATAELEQSFGRYWSARIVSSTDYVTLDDWVIPFESAPQETVEAAPDLAGSIVAVRDDLVLAGEANVVYTDLGSDEGVKPGDEFRVVRPGAGGRRGGPDRPVGILRIVAVQSKSSSAYVTRSTEPILIGDRVEHALADPKTP